MSGRDLRSCLADVALRPVRGQLDDGGASSRRESVDTVENATHDGSTTPRVDISRSIQELPPQARVGEDDPAGRPSPQRRSDLTSHDGRAITGAVPGLLLVAGPIVVQMWPKVDNDRGSAEPLAWDLPIDLRTGGKKGLGHDVEVVGWDEPGLVNVTDEAPSLRCANAGRSRGERPS